MNHNPNNHDAYQITGTGYLAGQIFGTTNCWHAPDTLATPMGIATLVGRQYVVTAPLLVVVLTGQGSCYHAAGCSHATNGTPGTLQQAQSLGYSPCSHCHPDTTTVAYVVAELREPKKPDYSCLYAAIG